MRDQQHGARKRFDRLLKHLERWNVQVVGGFVKHQNVGGLKHHARNVCARTLATRKIFHGLQKLRVLEKKSPRPRGDVHGATLKIHDLAQRTNGVAQQCIFWNVGSLLAQNHNARHGIGKSNVARVGLHVAAQNA